MTVPAATRDPRHECDCPEWVERCAHYGDEHVRLNSCGRARIIWHIGPPEKTRGLIFDCVLPYDFWTDQEIDDAFDGAVTEMLALD